MKQMEVDDGEKHALEMRESRNRVIEAEVDTRRTRAERDKVIQGII